MNQTAVEFLYEALSEEPKDIFMWQIILQQAKKMEKEQIRMAFVDGKWDGKCKDLNSEQYYNKTFEK